MSRVSIPADVAERAKDFVGRLWVLNEVMTWVDHGSERYLLITGEPGSGKTALAAWLAGSGPGSLNEGANSELERIRDLWGAAHFCVGRGQDGTLHPAQFARSLARQLSDRYDAYAVAIVQRVQPEMNLSQVVRENWGTVIGAQIGTLILNSDARDEYQRVVREPLVALSKNRPDLRVFILVDALDEALLYGTSNIATLLADSSDLPPGVRFLLTSRRDPRALNLFDQPGTRRVLDLSSPIYTLQIDTDIRAYVRQWMAGERMKERVAEIGSPAEVEDLLVKHAAGNFLYIAFLLNEVSNNKRSLAFAGLPAGLYGLYRQYLDRILPEMQQYNSSPRWVGEYQPLLGCLSVAMPAAPRRILPGWLGRSRGEVWPLLNDIIQVTEYDPNDGGGDRLYHRSMAEFLAAEDYEEDDSTLPNSYFTPPDEQHERIIRYYLTNFQGAWQECDLYGLRQIVAHMQIRLSLEQNPRERTRWAEELYAVVLDPAFLQAQREKLGGIHSTLNDLRTTLEIAMERNDLVEALTCVGIYREAIRSGNIAQSIFAAVQVGNFKLALKQAEHYDAASGPRGRWAEVLRYYLAWEAAEAGDEVVARELLPAAARLAPFGLAGLCDALLVRIARTLAHKSGGLTTPKELLRDFDREQDADVLLNTYDLAQPLGSVEQQILLESLEKNLVELERLVTEGAVEAISMLPFVTGNLQDVLGKLAATNEGQGGIIRALKSVEISPYPQYRDIALDALGVASLAVPDPAWVRQRLQTILLAALDHEGVAFTFDLPSILLAEAEQRKLPAQALTEYLDRVLSSNDRWGTVMRGRSARAAALLRQGRVAEAGLELEQAAGEPSGFAGYATITMLSLANRCYELGRPERAFLPLWGQSHDTALLALARQQAENVADPMFRWQRVQLVDAYQTWWNQGKMDLEAARVSLAGISDQDTRMAYIDHVTARWSEPIGLNWEGLKALLPLSLLDGTTLDAVLGRLVGLSVRQFSDEDLTEAIQICAKFLTTGRPWDLGQWS